MSEGVVADFVARFTLDTFDDPEPVRGRIVLSRKGIVLVSSDSRTSIPLGAIFDVNVGYVSNDLAEFFQDTVTIAYRRDASHVVAIEAGSEEVDRFTTLLFKAMLNGTTATAKHPARVGGRVTDEPYRSARLHVREGAVEFSRTSDTVGVDLATVTHFERRERSVGDAKRTVLSVRHAVDGEMVTSEFVLTSERKLNVLGRYLAQEYSKLVEQAEDIDVSEEEIQALVAIYSGGDSSTLPGVLGADSSYVTMLLNTLGEKGLIVEGERDLSLSTQGRMFVSDRIEDVNA